jgi:hypothetical protein
MALTRKTPLQRKTPLARTGWKKKPHSPFSSLATRAQWERRKPMKRRAKKPTVAEGSKYLAACRGEPCYLNACCPWTDWADPTVVDCHSNQARHGKAGARKADNEFTVPGCAACHYWLDFGKAPWEVKCAKFDDALARWAPVRARKMGLTEVVA